jgi:non-lysosomal glucosylceramidase
LTLLDAGLPASVTAPSQAWTRDVANTSGTVDGIPVGGLGAGTITWRSDGNFYTTRLQISAYNDDGSSFVPDPNVGFYYFSKNLTSGAKTMLPLSSLAIQPGQATYAALFPESWVNYYGSQFPVAAQVTQFSPLIPGDYQRSSYPVGIYQWQLSNPSSVSQEAAIMLTFPQGSTPFLYTPQQDGSNIGIVLGRSSGNAQTVQDRQIALACGAPSGVTVSYGMATVLSSLESSFFAAGSLPNNSGSLGAPGVGAMAFSVVLGPGQSVRVPLALAWDIPIAEPGSGPDWYREYTRYFGQTGLSAWAIADQALANAQSWESQIDTWQAGILGSAKYPDWLKTTLFNELYDLTSAGTMWEAGAASGQPNLPDQDQYGQLECNAYGDYGTSDVWFYGSWAIFSLWPNLDEQVVRQLSDSVSTTRTDRPPPLGTTAHEYGTTNNVFQAWDTAYNDNPPNWKDLNSKFVLMVYRDWSLGGQSSAFLSYCWPSVKIAMAYVKAQDSNGGGLPVSNGAPDNTYDFINLYGDTAYTGGEFLAACQAAQQLAQASGDTVSASAYQSWFQTGQATFESKLWNGTYYNIDTSGTAQNRVMADQLNGQWISKALGLGGIVSDAHATSALQTVYNLNYQMFDSGMDGVVNVMSPGGVIQTTDMESPECWVGTSWSVAAGMVYENMDSQALTIGQSLYNTIYNTAGLYFRTPEAWTSQLATVRAHYYMRAPAVWALKQALDTMLCYPATCTPTMTYTASLTPSPSFTASPTATRSPIVSATPTWTRSPTATRSPSNTPSPHVSPTISPSPTSSPTATPSPTPYPPCGYAFGSEGSGQGQFFFFYSPSLQSNGMAVDANGTVWVTQSFSVVSYSGQSAFLSQFGADGSGPGQLQYPSGIAISPSGLLYVADTGNNRVEIFTKAGAYSGVIGGPGSGNGAFNTPLDLAFDAQGELYVDDAGNNLIQKFDASGNFLLQFGGTGTGPGQLSGPYALATDPLGNLFVADTGNDRIQKFSPQGSLMAVFATVGSSPGSSFGPRGVAVDSQGYVTVSDTGNDRVLKFDQAGVLQGSFGSYGTGQGQFNRPAHLCVDSSGQFDVIDSMNSRIYKGCVMPVLPTTATLSATVSPTISASATGSSTPSPTSSLTATPTATASATPSVSPSPTGTATATDTPSASPCATATASPSATPSASATVSPSATPTPQLAGDGSAAMDPLSVLTGSQNTLVLTYTAGNAAWVNGALQVNIPADWTPPQSETPGLPGYYTVTFNNGDDVTYTEDGNSILISAASLDPVDGWISIAYGDTQGGQSPGSAATAPSSPETEIFEVLTDPQPLDPDYPLPSDISVEPSVSILAPTPSPTATPCATTTASPTATPSATPSVSPSSSPTLTFTLTGTSSLTATPSGTPTATPTDSPTTTPSVTLTPSPTATASATPSMSPSSSPTPSATGSASPSVTPSGTPTDSPTASPTLTFTPSSTSSLTASPSGTPTASATSTWTGSPTATATITPTSTPTSSGTPSVTTTSTPTFTITASPSPSASPTATSSATPTFSWTPTFTGTPSSSPTATGTLSSTKSVTATPSASPTATVTPTGTPEPTGTVTMTRTATVAASSTPSATRTASPTSTRTASSTATMTASPTSILPATRTRTPTPSRTMSPVQSPTRTPTLTRTATRTPTPAATTHVKSGNPSGMGDLTDSKADAPAPWFRGNLGVAPNPAAVRILAGFVLPTAGVVQLRIYALDGRLALSVDLGNQGAGLGQAWADIGGLASGVYFMELVESNEGTSVLVGSCKLAVLR